MSGMIQVGGRNFAPKGRHANGDRAYVTSSDPDNPPPYFHASTPDPNNPGRRLFWLFVYRTGKHTVKYIIPGVALALGALEIVRSFLAAMEQVPLW